MSEKVYAKQRYQNLGMFWPEEKAQYSPTLLQIPKAAVSIVEISNIDKHHHNKDLINKSHCADAALWQVVNGRTAGDRGGLLSRRVDSWLWLKVSLLLAEGDATELRNHPQRFSSIHKRTLQRQIGPLSCPKFIFLLLLLLLIVTATTKTSNSLIITMTFSGSALDVVSPGTHNRLFFFVKPSVVIDYESSGHQEVRRYVICQGLQLVSSVSSEAETWWIWIVLF